MIDRELIKEVIEIKKQEHRTIEWDEPFSRDDLQWLSQWKWHDIQPFFKPVPKDKTGAEHRCDLQCSKCGKWFKRTINRTDLQEILTNMRLGGHPGITHRSRRLLGQPVECADCEEARLRSLPLESSRESPRYNNTFGYLPSSDPSFDNRWRDVQSTREFRMIKNIYEFDYCLRPDLRWDSNVSWRDRVSFILDPFKHLSPDSWLDQYVYLVIKDLAYYDFLKTPYWKAISSHVKYKQDFRCGLCNTKGPLATHHKTYDHHGEEHRYWKTDLIALCNDCHEKHHDIV